SSEDSTYYSENFQKETYEFNESENEMKDEMEHDTTFDNSDIKDNDKENGYSEFYKIRFMEIVRSLLLIMGCDEDSKHGKLMSKILHILVDTFYNKHREIVRDVTVIILDEWVMKAYEDSYKMFANDFVRKVYKIFGTMFN